LPSVRTSGRILWRYWRRAALLEELATKSKHASLKARVVGIVKVSDLNAYKQADGNYVIDKTLIEHFDTREIKNLPKGFEKQYILPFGTAERHPIGY